MSSLYLLGDNESLDHGALLVRGDGIWAGRKVSITGGFPPA